MAYQATNATNIGDLLSALVTFATAHGWTSVFDVNGADGRQIGLSSGNCKVVMGVKPDENPVARVDTNTGTTQDYVMYANLVTSFNSSNHFWGQPGSPCTYAGASESCWINDLKGPFDEVYFFGDSSYVYAVVKTAGTRWTMFGFGLLDNKGMTTPRTAFLFGQFIYYWSTFVLSRAGYNASVGSPNRLWPISVNPEGQFQLMVPNGAVETAYGFSAGDHVYLSHERMGFIADTTYPGNSPGNFGSKIIDFADGLIDNQPTTGGAPLTALPVLVSNGSGASLTAVQTFVGDIPKLRMVDLKNISDRDLIEYGDDQYMCFPWWQRGTLFDGGGPVGAVYNGKPNSYSLGWAVKKEA